MEGRLPEKEGEVDRVYLALSKASLGKTMVAEECARRGLIASSTRSEVRACKGPLGLGST